VLVTVEYEIEATNSDEFLAALEKFSRVRRRDGASRWAVYYDTEHPTRYVETFIVDSWGEHLRQHTRLTQADREIEERVHRLAAKPAKVRHFIYARRKNRTYKRHGAKRVSCACILLSRWRRAWFRA
jgi:hypothetical protein